MKYSVALERAREMRKKPTKAEAFFWQKVRGKSIGDHKFHRQYIIEYRSIQGNKLYYIVDFLNYSNNLIVEVDGKIHNEQVEYDIERQRDLESLGYTIIRFTNDEVLYKWDMVEKELRKYLK